MPCCCHHADLQLGLQSYAQSDAGCLQHGAELQRGLAATVSYAQSMRPRAAPTLHLLEALWLVQPVWNLQCLSVLCLGWQA